MFGISWKRSIAVIFVIAFLSSQLNLLADVVGASEYRFQQEIIPLPCESSPEAPPCPMVPPLVGAVVSNQGRPHLTGNYDRDRAIRLLVEVAEVIYEQGVDPELTVLSGAWTLDLSNMVSSIMPGSYIIIVTTIDSHGNEVRGFGQLMVERKPTTETPGDRPPDVLGVLPSTGQSLFFFGWLSVTAISTAIGLIIFLIKFNRKPKN